MHKEASDIIVELVSSLQGAPTQAPLTVNSIQSGMSMPRLLPRKPFIMLNINEEKKQRIIRLILWSTRSKKRNKNQERSPLIMRSVASSSERPRLRRVSSCFESTEPMAASWVTWAV